MLPEFLKLGQHAIEQDVFRYLRFSDRPTKLRNVTNKAVLACTSRTGSSLLQVSLERYGLDPREYMNPEGPARRFAEKRNGATVADFGDDLATNAVSGDWFIVKGAANVVLFLYYWRELPEFAQDWKFIFLRRRNIVRQAISMEIARRTQRWTSKMPGQGEVSPDDYSFEAIRRHVQSIFAQNDRWERAFGFLGIDPLRLFYEDFSAHLLEETERVASFLGIDVARFPGSHEHAIRIDLQSTELNDLWETRFRREFAEMVRDRNRGDRPAVHRPKVRRHQGGRS